MEPQELSEDVEKAKESGDRPIGLSMSIFAVLLAVATMLSHRAHTEEMLLETRATDQWNYYQAKNIRSHVYEADAQIAALLGDRGTQAAADFHAKSEKQKADSEKIQEKAEELGKEVTATEGRARFFDGSELCLEVAIVLSSISLLTRSRVYWKVSFFAAAAGIAVAIWGMLS
jgi:uncharacterized protein DUF4337